MRKQKRISGASLILVGVLLLIALAGCTPQTAEVPEPVIKTVEVPVPVVETVEVPMEVTVPVEVTRIVEVTPTPVAPPQVPQEVADIISDKCAACHMELPWGHTDFRNVDQCGLCHVPYGNTSEMQHTATLENCTDCHQTPQVTHFYLRDEEDQTILAANAVDRCIACHRDGGNQTTGRGSPSLVTDAEIFAAVAQGTLRPWIQPGGFMAKYLAPDEAATLTAWIDTVDAGRTVDYDPYLDAAKIGQDFDISPLGDNPAWESAQEHVVSVLPTIYTSADEIRIKALYSDNYLYIRAEWEDSTASLTRSGSWILDDGTWRHPAAASENDKQSEDRISFIWNISAPDFRANYGCAGKCHGNVPGSSEFTDMEGATMDIWHGKAGRGIGLYQASDSGNLQISTSNESFEVTQGQVSFLGTLDDKRLVWYMDLDDGYDLEDSGRRGDAGGGAYKHNRNGDKSAPLFIEIAPESWADAMVLTEVETTDGSTIVADPSDPAYNAAAVAAAWENYLALGAVVPERILREPGGSRADVLYAGSWQNGVWVQVMRRALVTGNPDDVQFDLSTATEYEFSMAVFDNCGRGEIPPGHTTYGDGQYQILRFK